jgi:hypothetical protein
MGQSLILLINELAPNQTNAFQTVNDAVAALESASNEPLAFDASAGGTIAVDILDMVRYGVFRVSGHTAAVTLAFASQVEDTVPVETKRIIGIINEEAYPVTLETDAFAGQVVVPPFSSKIVLIDFEDVHPLAASPPHTVGAYSFGTPGASDVILRYNFVETVEYQDNFLASIGSIATNPTSSFVIDVNKNGSPIGTITISTGGVFTFATTGATAERFDYEDILELVAPATPDATAAGISITLLAKRL